MDHSKKGKVFLEGARSDPAHDKVKQICIAAEKGWR